MNKQLLGKGMKRMGLFILMCFIAPILLYQAFKNQGHPFFWLVFILGLVGFFYTIFLGFRAIKTLVHALLGPTNKEKSDA